MIATFYFKSRIIIETLAFFVVEPLNRLAGIIQLLILFFFLNNYLFGLTYKIKNGNQHSSKDMFML